MITTYNLYGPVEQTKVDLVTLGGNSYPAGKITEKAMWMSVFLTKRYRILNADSTKTPSSVLLFSDFAGWVAS